MNTSERIAELNREMLKEFDEKGIEDTLANRYKSLSGTLEVRKGIGDGSVDNYRMIVALEIETARLFSEIHSPPEGS
jgi:hypothetical protein